MVGGAREGGRSGPGGGEGKAGGGQQHRTIVDMRTLECPCLTACGICPCPRLPGKLFYSDCFWGCSRANPPLP